MDGVVSNRKPRRQNGKKPSAHQQVVISEVLDRVLNKGAMLAGRIVISVADIDLLYVGLKVLLASIESAEAAQARVRNKR